MTARVSDHITIHGSMNDIRWMEGVVGWSSVESSQEFKALKKILYSWKPVFHLFDTPVIVVGVRPADKCQRQVSADAGLKFARKCKALFHELDEEMIRCMEQPRQPKA